MSTALAVYTACVLLLFLKMLALSCYQGYYRLRYRAFVNTEDAAVFGRPTQAAERAEVQRASQAWRNDLENIPMFCVLGALALTLQAGTQAIAWLCMVFSMARVLHSLAYLAGWQPWRTFAYAVALGCLLGLAGIIGQQLIQSPPDTPPGAPRSATAPPT